MRTVGLRNWGFAAVDESGLREARELRLHFGAGNLRLVLEGSATLIPKHRTIYIFRINPTGGLLTQGDNRQTN